MLTASAQPRTCCMCPKEFWPRSSLHRVCSQRCATKLATQGQKEKEAAAKAERAQDRVKRESFKSLAELAKAAQVSFNAFVRSRDANRPCICCRRTETTVDGLGAHGWDAGHYRSIGSASHLRFNEDNCHRQLVLCNRYGAGRAVDYRLGLIARIGLERVEALEADNQPRKWTREELIAKRAEYRAKLKQLTAAQD